MRPIRSHWLMALILGSTLLVTTAAGAADEAAPGAQHSRGHMMARLQQQLGLTDAQVQSIRDVHARHADSRKQLGQSLRQAQADLRQLALNGSDPTALEAKSAEVGQLLSQGVSMRVQTLQEIAPILTPEQRVKLAQMSPGMFMHHHHHGAPPPAS
jgi:Spy/CpxP family protein refolding chaperone